MTDLHFAYEKYIDKRLRMQVLNFLRTRQCTSHLFSLVTNQSLNRTLEA